MVADGAAVNTSKGAARTAPQPRLTPPQPRRPPSALLRVADSSEGPKVPLAAGGFAAGDLARATRALWALGGARHRVVLYKRSRITIADSGYRRKKIGD